MTNSIDEVAIEELRNLANLLTTFPDRLLRWEIQRDPLSRGIDRSATVTITYAIPWNLPI